MKAKNLKNRPKALKAQTLLIISIIIILIGLILPIIFGFGIVILLFAVNAFVMENLQTKNPKMYSRLNVESERFGMTMLTALTILSVLAVIMCSSGIVYGIANQSDTASLIVIFFMLVTPTVYPIIFLYYNVSHISKKTESSSMFTLRVASIIIAALVFGASTSGQNAVGFSAIGAGIEGLFYSSCSLLVIGTFIPEKMYLSSRNIHKK